MSSLKPERVQSVLDGDTIRFSEYDLRLQGINTPEMNYHLKPQRPEPYAELATNSVKRLLSNAAVFVEVSGRDKYSRQLGSVWLKPDGRWEMLSELLVAQGLAFQVFESDSVYVSCLLQAERLAEKQALGVWSDVSYWLNVERGGFVIWRGLIKGVARSKRYYWLSLSDNRVVRVPSVWLSEEDGREWQEGQMIDVRGWVVHRKATPYEAFMLPLKSRQIFPEN